MMFFNKMRMLAVFTGSVGLAEALFPLDRRLPENAANAEGTPESSGKLLYLAVQSRAEDVAIALINAGADMDFSYGDGWTGLHDAVQRLLPNIVEKFVEKGANVNAPCYGYTPLHNIVAFAPERLSDEDLDKVIRVLEELLRHPAIDLSATAQYGGKRRTPLEILEEPKIEKRLGKKTVQKMKALIISKLVQQALDQKDNRISPNTPDVVVNLIGKYTSEIEHP